MRTISKKTVYSYRDSLNTEFRDIGRWRSYSFDCEGSTMREMFDTCTIFETDRDGKDVYSCGLYDANNTLIREAQRSIALEFEDRFRDRESINLIVNILKKRVIQ